MTLILQLRIELDFKSMVEFNLAEVESDRKSRKNISAHSINKELCTPVPGGFQAERLAPPEGFESFPLKKESSRVLRRDIIDPYKWHEIRDILTLSPKKLLWPVIPSQQQLMLQAILNKKMMPNRIHLDAKKEVAFSPIKYMVLHRQKERFIHMKLERWVNPFQVTTN